MSTGEKVTIGDKIRKYREEKGWSQKELADRAEVSPSTISKAEGAVFTPAPDKLQRVADALGIPFHELVDLEADLQVDTLLEILAIHLHRREYHDSSKVIDELKRRSDLLGYQKNQLAVHEAEWFMRTKNVQQAIDVLLHLARTLETERDSDVNLLALVYNKLGIAYYYSSEMLNAHNYYSRAYQISLQFTKPDPLSAHIAYNLGQVCLTMRRDSEAIAYLETAKGLYEKVSDPRKLADALYVLGLSYLNAKKVEKAEEIIKQSRTLYESLNVLAMAQLVKRQYAFFILANMEPEKAIDELIESLSHLKEVGDLAALAYTHSNIAFLLLKQDDIEKAKNHLFIALELIPEEEFASNPKYPYIYRIEACYHLKIKEYDKSIECAFKSSELFGKMGLERERASSLEVAVEAYKGLGDVHAALEVSERVTRVLSDAFPVNPIY